jgi:glycosyltransferase involved in cell wall biosynthesis
LLSIIIPTYNEEKLIGKTLSQFTDALRTKYDIQLIVSDGGSTDRTLEIVGGFPCEVVLHSESRKQTIAEGRNAGARVAHGDILFFLNADTVIDDHDVDGFLSTALAVLKDRRVVAVTCSVYIYPEEAIRIDRIVHTLYNWYFYSLNLIGMGMGRGECQIIKRDAFWKVGGNRDRIAAGEDFDLFTRLIRIGRISFLQIGRAHV